MPFARAWLVGVGLAACYSPTVRPGSPCHDSPCPIGLVCSPVDLTCQREGPGGPDAPAPDAPALPDAQVCFGGGAGLEAICLAKPPDGPRVFEGVTSIDTGAFDGCVKSDRDELCVIVATDLAISPGATVRARGTRPLVLLASGSIAIDGTLEVASRVAGAQLGAGANSPLCATVTAPENRAGGPGGTMRGRGGAAGSSSFGGVSVPAAPVSPVVGLRGGCPGRAGAGATPDDHGGAGGPGGGAGHVLAGVSISVDGTINASGGGGAGALESAGGGGGGSGGMIVLEAPIVTGTGTVFANGGGGGEGASTNSGNSGADPTAPTMPAQGGRGGAAQGGDGGNGSAGSTLAGQAGSNGFSAGGGGGGGAGLIRVAPLPHAITGAISPPPMP